MIRRLTGRASSRPAGGQRLPARRYWPALVAAVVTALSAGCSIDKPKPAPLEELTPRIAGSLVWNQGGGKLDFPLVPAVRDGAFFVAGSDGVVRALTADNGAELWRADVRAPIAAGVGSDGRFTSVVTRDNEVVTLDSGREVWRKRVPSAAVTPPFVAGERVFVMTVDRVVHAFDALDGRRLWVYNKPGDALTLAQPGVLAAWRNTLLAGQGPRLVGLEPTKGELQWDAALATPRGSNEVERLADLVGPPVRGGSEGSRFCARAFQAAVACADAARGAVLWSRTVGGTQAVAGDGERVIAADASDRITAWRAENGDVLWTNEKFVNRVLSGALAAGTVVVFGDFEGYVHFLSAATGELQLRLPTDGSPVVGTPAISGETVLVTTRAGGLFAFRPR